MMIVISMALVAAGIPSVIVGLLDESVLLMIGAALLMVGLSTMVIHHHRGSDEFARTRIIRNEARIRLLKEENNRLRLRIEGREP